MKVRVDYVPTDKSVVYDLPDGATTSDLKQAIFDSEGSPCEYQSIRMNERELSSDFPLSPDARVQLSLTLDGGKPHFSAGDFVCYFRCMCCFSGLDGDWKSCQWFCFKV